MRFMIQLWSDERARPDPGRVAAWRKLQRELAWVEDRRAASRAREARGREITLFLRNRVK